MDLTTALQRIVDNKETTLIVNYSIFSNEWVAALATALHFNWTLIKLNLNDNLIGDDGATALATALHYNTTLTYLSLSNNNIGDDGVTALATALHRNTTLTYLYLISNNIGDDGATALATALDRNTTVQYLGLNCRNAIETEIKGKVQRNVILYRDMFWQPAWHSDFPSVVHDLVVTTLLCNHGVGEKKLPRLPLVVWKAVFSFYRRKDIS